VRLVVRTGINTGEVMAGDPGAGQAFVSGDSVNVAARLEQVAPPVRS
jgi:class 3 adenylate cyclase